MSIRLQVWVIVISIIILVGIVDLVRRRKLREEYSFLWLVLGFGLLVLAIFPKILSTISRAVGISMPVNTLFFIGLLFIFLICLYFSLRISSLTNQVKNLTQEVALLEARLQNKVEK
ncbi:MAG: DUF2304 domain-containing protein [Bacteroidota bacterium]